ncbi:MAG: hypothetical protein ABNG96_03960 [Flavobacterium sp.]|jgi:hypothetical protein
MTKRDFFRLLIKVFGLYSCITTIFYFVPQLFSSYIYDFNLAYILIMIGSVLLILALLFILIFKADIIINILNLDSGFDDDNVVLGNLSSESILLFSVTIIAGIMIVNGIPDFLYHLINAFKKEVSLYSIDNQEVNYFGLVSEFLNIILGYVLLVNNKKISKILDRN